MSDVSRSFHDKHVFIGTDRHYEPVLRSVASRVAGTGGLRHARRMGITLEIGQRIGEALSLGELWP